MTDEDKIREEQKKYLENQLHENQERIHKLTYYNPITFLPNRKKLIKKFNESIESPGEMKEKGIILLDIDRFHSINELYGRAVGED